jgi:nucleoside-diphosphate-sugar epimerase
MIIAVTGASGFIGTALLEKLLARGDTVRVLTRREDVHWSTGVRPHVGDLSDPAAPNALAAFCDGADVLFHCAGDYRDESRMVALHVRGTQHLLQAARGRIGRWVQLSSVGAYGPYRDGIVTEDSPLAPVGLYEETKTDSDRLVLAAAAAGDIAATLLRPATVFGPSMPNQSIFQLIAAIDRGRFFFIGPPGASANYVSVAGVVEALLLCASRPMARNRTYNLADWCSMEIWVGAICGELGRLVPTLRLPVVPLRMAAGVLQGLPGFPLTRSRVDALTNRSRYANSRIETELGYRHPVTLEQGARDMVSAWKARSWLGSV